MSRSTALHLAAGAIAVALGGHAALGASLVEPQVFASSGGVLDIVMVAKAAPLNLPPFKPEGWVYDICRRTAPTQKTCPATGANLYAGTRLQLQKGDTLRIRLVNHLPTAPLAKHQKEPGFGYLLLNPTNLHTHGLLVSTHYPTMANRTYGDNVFVLTLNPKNGAPPAGSHIHGDVRQEFTDYEIKIPRSHPSGLYWFHPHAHAIALNQISAGLAGIITIGDPADYMGISLPLRHLILRDTQVLPPASLIDQQVPTFCPFDPLPGETRRGSCLNPFGSGTGKNRGRWFFTINGQEFPDVSVNAPFGQVWRITNASASVTYRLELIDAARKARMLMQVLSIDGVSVRAPGGTTNETFNRLGGTKFEAATCPGVAGGSSQPLCVKRLVLFPSSRVELWVTYRNARGLPALPPPGAQAILRNLGIVTGPGGDAWPPVDLARINFTRGLGRQAVAAALDVHGDAPALMQPARLAAELAKDERAAGAPQCAPLAPGHKRRIFFNSLPGGDADGDESPFGLGYEEIDEHNRPVPGTELPITVFNAGKRVICLPLGPGNTPAKERWELINLASEDHNFHMHQTRFRLLTDDEVAGTTTPIDLGGKGILHDNVPVRHADGNCVTADDWRAGKCTAHPVWVEIPFSIAGDYVYHCHILEHEDGGMMARIRVQPNP